MIHPYRGVGDTALDEIARKLGELEREVQELRNFKNLSLSGRQIKDSIQEERRWEEIASAQSITEDTAFSWSPGKYDIVRGTLRGSLNNLDWIRIQINGLDSGYRRSYAALVFEDWAPDPSNRGSDTGEDWRVARWGTATNNSAWFEVIRPTASGSFAPTFSGGGYRAAGGTSLRMTSFTNGDYGTVDPLESVTVRAGSGNMGTVRVWLKGHIIE